MLGLIIVGVMVLLGCWGRRSGVVSKYDDYLRVKGLI